MGYSYTVQNGDTLSSIVKKLAGSYSQENLDKIVSSSGIKDPNLIIVGQTLNFPDDVVNVDAAKSSGIFEKLSGDGSTPSTPSTPNTPSTPSTPNSPNTPSTPNSPNTPSTPSNPTDSSSTDVSDSVSTMGSGLDGMETDDFLGIDYGKFKEYFELLNADIKDCCSKLNDLSLKVKALNDNFIPPDNTSAAEDFKDFQTLIGSFENCDGLNYFNKSLAENADHIISIGNDLSKIITG